METRGERILAFAKLIPLFIKDFLAFHHIFLISDRVSEPHLVSVYIGGCRMKSNSVKNGSNRMEIARQIPPVSGGNSVIEILEPAGARLDNATCTTR